jgi:hypothetical protein
MRSSRIVTMIALVAACGLAAARPASANVKCGEYQSTDYGMAQICDAGIPSHELDVTAQIEPNVQQQSNWCWAAAISGVFAYYGHPVSQARIVREAYGGIANMRGSPQAIMGSLNRDWVDDAGRPFEVTANMYSGSWVTAAQDLAQNRPLIVGSLGHAMILTAAEYTRYANGNGQIQGVIVRDPWPSNPRRRALSTREAYGVQMLIRIRVTS